MNVIDDKGARCFAVDAALPIPLQQEGAVLVGRENAGHAHGFASIAIVAHAKGASFGSFLSGQCACHFHSRTRNQSGRFRS